MKTRVRFFRWIIGAMATLLTLAVVAVVIFTHTARFGDLLRVRLVNYLNQNYRGHFAIGKIGGSIWGNLILRDLNVSYDNSPVLSVPLVRLDYQLLPLLSGRVNVSLLLISAPALDLATVSNGQWNLLAALSERNPQPASPSSFSPGIQVDRFALERADISVQEPSGRRYELFHSHLRAAAEIESAGTRVDVSEVGSQIRTSDAPEVNLGGKLTYNTIGSPDGSLRISVLSLRTQDSDLSLSGAATNLKKKTVDATLAIRKLAAADVNAFVPKIGLAQDLSGTVRITSETPETLRIESAIAAGQSHINSRVRANVTEAEPSYDAEAQIAGLNFRELFRAVNGRSLPGGVINGTMHASGRGKDIAGLSAETNLQDQGVVVNGWGVGDLSLAASFKRKIATVNATLTSKAGRARLEGDVDTAGATAYKLRLAVKHLELRQMNRNAGVPAGDLNMIANLQGVGLQPATMDTKAHLTWLRSSIGPVTIDRGKVDARISRGVLHITDVYIDSQGARASARGEFAFVPNQRGHLYYALDARQLAPWLALAGHQGNGSVKLAGDAAGNLRSLRASGSGELSALRVDKYSIGHGRLSYDLSGISKATNSIRGQVGFQASDLRTGIQLKSLATDVRLEPGRAETAYLSVNAVETPSGTDALAAQVSYEPRRISVNLTQLSLATDAGTWRLNRAAEIIQENGETQIHALRLDNDDQHVWIDGTVSNHGAQNLKAQVERLRLATLSQVLPKEPQLRGMLSAQLSVRGTAAAPEVTLRTTLNNLEVSSVRFEGLSTNLEYAPTRASVAMKLQQDTAHWLDVHGSLPVRVSWSQGFEHQETGDMSLQAKSTGLDLAFLEAFGGGSVKKVRGTLSMDVTAEGPLNHPRPHGFIELADAQFLVKPLGVQIKKAAARVALTPGEVQLVNLSAAAGEGTMTGHGRIGLPGSGPEQTNLKITLDNWPAINTPQYQAAVAANVGCSGPMNALRIEGQTEVLHALLRPELTLLQAQSLKQDDTIKVAASWTPPAPKPNEQKKNAAQSTSAFQNAAVNVYTTIHRNTWIKAADSEVELEGKVHTVKQPHKDLMLVGTINTVRGKLIVAGKTFKVSHGRIMFTGGHKIDPSLDIAAQYKAQRYQITAAVTGTAKKPVLALSSVPDLPQTDILSVLMFGKPANQLSGGEQKGLQKQALSMASGAAASQLGQAITQSLGLETLGVSATDSGLGLGTYLTENTYISASQEGTGNKGGGASISYYLAPDLELNTSASTSAHVGNQIELKWTKDY